MDLASLLSPRSIAIAGLSADPTKHGQRVLANLRKVGFAGEVWGVHPRQPEIDGVEVFASIGDLPSAPDVVVSAVPASAVGGLALEAGRKGAGTLIVFAGGFAESGTEGSSRQAELLQAKAETGLRILGPNSGGVITPSAGVAMSFLTCLDRPAAQIRSGLVGLVTQSGGMGSYVHNLAAGRGDGLAASISTGNEADLGVADGVSALAEMAEVKAIAVILETVRNGPAFAHAVEAAHAVGKPVVVTRIGRSERGRRLMATHTGALAKPERVLRAVLDELGVTVAETPEEMFDVASVLARTPKPSGPRVGVITHSGGLAILLSDLADGSSIVLPEPSPVLRARLEPLLQQGAVDNPLDMGGIIGGPHRFAEVVSAFADSGEVDSVLAVSSAHPPAHSEQRVKALLAADVAVPVIQLWMAGDVGAGALDMLRAAQAPVTEEPRAAIRALSALATPRLTPTERPPLPADVRPSAPLTEFEAKAIVEGWGFPVVAGRHATTQAEAVDAAEAIGYPVVVKLSSPDVTHKTEIGGVATNLVNSDAVREAFVEVQTDVPAGARVDGVLVERHINGPEVIIGGVRDETFGPMILLGIGGVVAEALDDVRVASAPISAEWARSLIDKLAGIDSLTHPRHGEPADLDRLAQLVSDLSDRLVSNLWLDSFDLNPVTWSHDSWVAVDAAFVLMRDQD
ncbi:MAG: acetate--CoA ligase family protein [Acidimicrobiia bacterium]|nr:acetate--CoA ligase family protein [Acidimicrobiia bacterium]